MPNPIFSFNRSVHQAPQSNNIFDLMHQIKNSQNPNATMQNMLSTNPRFKDMVDYINQNGGDAKTAFYNLAAQKGVDPNSILNQLR